VPERVEQDAVFLNIPYDTRFKSLYLAYVAGLVELGLTPKATLGISGSTARLDRIFRLIRTCRYSIHDLSRVQLDRTPPPTPRFNMPFELGLAVAWTKLNSRQHTFFVYESKSWRIQKSISDLNGVDPHVHHESPEGVLRQLRNSFVRRRNPPTLTRMMAAYGDLVAAVHKLSDRKELTTVFEASAFRDLIAIAARRRDLSR
jgi:hypothetical protein